MKISAENRTVLLSLIERFPLQRVVMLGDLVADEFIHGEIARVSREAPVLILRQKTKHIVPGGGANAANNLADLGARVDLIGVVGEDEPGDALCSYFAAKRVSTRRVRRVRGYTTPTKSRVLGGLGHGHLQQIVRVDREPNERLSLRFRRELTRAALASLSLATAVLVSDYGYGAADASEVRRLEHSVKRRMPLTVDSRYDILSYNGATASTPNEQELEAAFRRRIDDNVQLLHRLATLLLKRSGLEALLVTRGREGMVLYEPHRKPAPLSIFGTDQVADVTGAGDTVIAAFTLALAAGASFLHAAMVANCAGGLVVMKSGTATVSTREIEEAIRNS